MKVGLCYNLKKLHGESVPGDFYAECDDEETIEAVRSALALRHQVILVEGDEQAYENFRSRRPDMVFNIAEGLVGRSRESQIPAMLEMLQIPYTGSDPLTLALCLDKAMAKDILAYHKIPTAPFTVVVEADSRAKFPPFPLIVKPLAEGSSKGVVNKSLVRTKKELQQEIQRVLNEYHQPALVEKFLPGREFTAALLGNRGEVEILPLVEIQFEQLPPNINPIYSYEAKWIWDTVENPLEIFTCPPKISAKLEKKIKAVCTAAFSVLRCRDWCRIDVRLDEAGEVHVLELNPLPGILPNPKANSCFPKAARAANISYEELINRVLDIACRRVGLEA